MYILRNSIIDKNQFNSLIVLLYTLKYVFIHTSSFAIQPASLFSHNIP